MRYIENVRKTNAEGWNSTHNVLAAAEAKTLQCTRVPWNCKKVFRTTSVVRLSSDGRHDTDAC
eukprot:177641-Rhodomonas_salina.1